MRKFNPSIAVILLLHIFFAFGLQANALSWQLQQGSSREKLLQEELKAANGAFPAESRAQKYKAMSVSPFTFFRGTAHLFFKDLGDINQRWQASKFYSSKAVSWLIGDLHTENFGAFSAPSGAVVYDVNDFDESFVTSYLLDVWRLGTSIALVAEQNGLSKSIAKNAIMAMANSYATTLKKLNNKSLSDEKAMVKKGNAYGLLDEFLTSVEKKKNRAKMLDKWSVIKDGKRVLNLSLPILKAMTSTERNDLLTAFKNYPESLVNKKSPSFFTVLDVARRLEAGTGSLGVNRFYVLIDGPTSSPDDDMILDVKAQGSPALFRALTSSEQAALKANFSDEKTGCRSITSLRAMLGKQADPYAGCFAADKTSSVRGYYSVRERNPFKATFDSTQLTSETRLTKLAEQWGMIAAAAHARASKNSFDAEFVRLVGKNENAFAEEVTNFSQDYSAQVALDYQLFLKMDK